jgi:hypothetical protein
MPMNVNPKKIVSMIIASKGKGEAPETKSSDEPQSDMNLALRDASQRFMDAMKAGDASAAGKAYKALHEVVDEMLESEEGPENESEENDKEEME